MNAEAEERYALAKWLEREAYTRTLVDSVADKYLRAAALLRFATKPLDDPRLQELFSSTIDGAIASGYQGVAQAPAGHWLEPWWMKGWAVAQAEAACVAPLNMGEPTA